MIFFPFYILNMFVAFKYAQWLEFLVPAVPRGTRIYSDTAFC